MQDVIIVGGENIYPQDIEKTIESVDENIRPGCSVACGHEVDGEERVYAFFEVRKVPGRPADLAGLAKKVWKVVRETHNVTCSVLAVFPPRSMPKTTSGKIRRREAREMYLKGELVPVYDHSTAFSRTMYKPGVLRVLGRVGKRRRSLMADYFVVYIAQKLGHDCDQLAEQVHAEAGRDAAPLLLTRPSWRSCTGSWRARCRSWTCRWRTLWSTRTASAG